MKKINLYILFPVLCLLLVVAACNKDEEELIIPSHRVIFTSEMDFENKIEVDNQMSFGDVSAGVVSRTWTFPANSGIDILDSDNDQTSTEANVTAHFNEVGVYEIKLSQTFEKEAFVGTKQVGRDLDTSIIVTVLEPVDVEMQAFFVNPDGTLGEELVLEDGALNQVPAGRRVQYSYGAVGAPENYFWDIDGGDPNVVTTEETGFEVKYRRLGTYDLSFFATRARPHGGDTVAFNGLIEVVPSTDPLTLDEVTAKDGEVALVFSRDIAPESLFASDFNVNIDDGWSAFDATISNVRVDEDDSAVVLISFDNERIYNDDVVLVSYSGTELASTDGVKTDTFTELPVVFRTVNILPDSDFDYSFESATSDQFLYLGWGDPWESYSLNVTSEQAYDGENSVFIEMDPEGGMIVTLQDLNSENQMFFVNENKDYELGVWVYVEDLGDTELTGFTPDLRLYWEPDTNWGIGGNPEFGADFPIGEWVYSSAFVNFSATGEVYFMIRGFNSNNSLPLKFYMDNITLAEVELRP